jgi:hypothetical protein
MTGLKHHLPVATPSGIRAVEPDVKVGVDGGSSQDVELGFPGQAQAPWVDPSIGNRVKTARMTVGVNQKDVVKVLPGVDKDQISSMERGLEPVPMDLLMKFAAIYQVDAVWLATGVGETPVYSKERALAVKKAMPVPGGTRVATAPVDDLQSWREKGIPEDLLKNPKAMEAIRIIDGLGDRLRKVIGPVCPASLQDHPYVYEAIMAGQVVPNNPLLHGICDEKMLSFEYLLRGRYDPDHYYATSPWDKLVAVKERLATEKVVSQSLLFEAISARVGILLASLPSLPPCLAGREGVAEAIISGEVIPPLDLVHAICRETRTDPKTILEVKPGSDC